jgi:predicted dithiol-disulfide oxidoreductase (DUF899 family)
MGLPEIVSREQWLAARERLLVREQELTLLRDAVTTERRRLPMVKIEKDYMLEGPRGQISLPELFGASRQLVVRHFMFDPSWEAGCPSCSASVDELCPGLLGQLRARDTAFAVVSLAPFAKIEAFRARNGWTFPWYSSFGSDFNYDFHVTLDETVAAVVYDYQSKAEILAADPSNDLVDSEEPVEVAGISCFLIDGGTVFHTYSAYGDGLELAAGVQGYLDLTALGGCQSRGEPGFA